MSARREAASMASAVPGAAAMPLHAVLADALRQARARLEQRDFAGAGRLYEGVLTMAPDHVEALHLLGLVHLELGNPARAEPLIARSMKFGLSQPWNLANHAAALTGVGRHRDALALADRALGADPDHAPSHAARGDALLALGQYDAALAAYDRALVREPARVTAWRKRGETLRRLERPADALISVERALRLDPGDAAANIERGHALRALGHREQALHSYQLAMVVRGKAPELVYACGVVMTELGRPADALACLDEGLARHPKDEQLLYASCVALDLLHARDELLKRCDRLLALNRGNVAAWVGRGNALLGLERHADAADAYAQALARNPDDIDARRNRAAALRALGRFDDALADYDAALALTGPHAELHYNRALALQQLGRYDEALASHAAAAAAPAETAQALFTRAVARQHLGNDDAALADYADACRREPNHGAARRSEAFCRLLTGDFDAGWRLHEARWDAADVMLHRRHADRPLWTGDEPLAGRTLLLHAEQGYGDTLQFCRYANLAHDAGATVIVEAPAALGELLGTLRGVSRVVTEGQPMPAFDLQCPLMSLPYAFRTTLDTVPADVPYLRADARRRDAWAQRLDAMSPPGRLRIGLVWSGNPRHANDENRSIPFAALLPLVAAHDATFVSLQPQIRARDADAFAASGVLSFADTLTDFSETAALVGTLDLVISVDTSVAHLAGALGRPVWLLLPRVPDWRWLLGRDDCPWYPSARLFRQARPGDWPAVIGRVADALGTVRRAPPVAA
ncbi:MULTISPECIES: tetratricopeptide repeat protein [Burkholderia]|jgi:tetratricopeptide (TPR) repeat protein|uniref:Tetratricopeptide repeat protein n=4 Tax=Bacteria TaxID=2 RepID=A0A250L1V4_9BURK|nr:MULTISPECIES: tetratricopeptide repeat protein [Burkholderia]UTP25954.1 tetratricopeptide repeat protein [Burkholderia sp. FXe9]MBA9828694.1 tetratricopeptide repeat protein [Burkholderia contaminans]MBA9840482.1 tetratricopeptide repeat protein [Burkholderia contaminans]MBA9860217.1 tetratricopeptide repeat protein [Burkholderia contaminans]MBA9903722.1 tetratricopeptide repeat protein [Burkholderia contaminans]